ncbi:MAG: flagellar hook-associated protein FlgL [Pyrinomonadaceae bacterium]|nr:flagellar hook-associated protein FlgL [Pyrinomonadaceae bacterium]
MVQRIADNTINANFRTQINRHQLALSVLQERLSSGKRINRPSDDPYGLEAVINLRTSRTEIEQFSRSATAANQKLVVVDESLNGYENVLDRVRALVTQGLSDTNTQSAQDALATEIEALRSRILSVANSQVGGEYVFGGTRQDAPPFDPVTAAPSLTASNAQYIQIEPGSDAIAAGVTAETVFADSTSNIFDDLTQAVTALRGTGDPAADRSTLENTFSRLKVYSDLAAVSHAFVGVNMEITEIVQDRLNSHELFFDSQISSIEDADFAETVFELSETQAALEATYRAAASSRPSLLDFIG